MSLARFSSDLRPDVGQTIGLCRLPTTEFDATRKRRTKPIPSWEFCRIAWNPCLSGPSYDFAKQSQFFLKLKKPKASLAHYRLPLRHLRPAALEDLRNPIGVGKTATRKLFQLSIHVILHAPDCGLRVIQQEICSAAIAVVRKAHAAGVGDGYS